MQIQSKWIQFTVNQSQFPFARFNTLQVHISLGYQIQVDPVDPKQYHYQQQHRQQMQYQGKQPSQKHHLYKHLYKHPHVRERDRYEDSYEKDRDPVTYPYADRVRVVYPVVEPVNPAVEPPAVAKTKEVGAIGVARPSPLLYSLGAYPGAFCVDPIIGKTHIRSLICRTYN